MLAVPWALDVNDAKSADTRFPRVIIPRWPKGRVEYIRIAYGVACFFWFCLALVSVWTVQATDEPGATADSTYRADRRASMLLALARIPGAIVPVAALMLGLGASWRLTAAVLSFLLGFGSLALLSGGYFRLRQTEFLFRKSAGERLNFGRLLTDGVDRQVLRQAGPVYQFRYPPLRDWLAATHAAVLAEGARQEAATVTAASGLRVWLLAFLSPDTIDRLSADFSFGITLFLAAAIVDIGPPDKVRVLLITTGIILVCSLIYVVGLIWHPRVRRPLFPGVIGPVARSLSFLPSRVVSFLVKQAASIMEFCEA